MLNVCANQFAGQLTLVNETNAGSTNLKKVEAEATNQTTSTEEAKKLTATVLEFSKAKETSSTKENGFFDAIGRFFKKVWTGIKETAKKVWEGVKQTAKKVWEGVKTAAKGIGEGFKKIFQGQVGEGFKTMGKGILEGVKTAGKGLYEGYKVATGAKDEIISKTLEQIK